MKPSAGACSAGLAVCLAGCSLPGTTYAQPPPAPRNAQSGGTITVGITPPGGIDPLDAYEPSGKLVAGLLCDTLVSIDPVTGDPVPGLVTSWQVSQNTVTLRLRHGVLMSNGHVLDARDVVQSLIELANPATASREAALMSEVQGYASLSQNLFAGTDAKLVGGPIVIDPFDLEIPLSTKDPGFIDALAEEATAPFLESAWQQDPGAFASDPICAGPYTLARPYHPGDNEILLNRSAHYYGKNVGFTGGGRGYADHILFRIYPTPEAAEAAFRAGQLDIAAVPAGAVPGRLSSGASLVAGPNATEEFIGIPDGLENQLNDPGIRRALSEALDRRAVIAAAWPGSALPALGFLPPDLSWATISDQCPALARATGNVAVARASLSAEQLTALSRLSMPLYVDKGTGNVAEALEIARQWLSDFGLHLTVQPMSWPDYLAKAMVGAGFDGPFRISWSADSSSPEPTDADPARFLEPLFGSSETTVANWAHYADSRLDVTLTDEATPASLGLTRSQEFSTVSQYLCQQSPMIPVAWGESRWLVRSSRVATARSSYLSTTGLPQLREVYLR